MSPRQAALGATEFTLLGLISRAGSDGPVHGYDLQRQLTESSLAHVIRVEPGMLYHYLKKLTAQVLITAEIATQQGRPARHLHAITTEGRALLDAWMTEPVATTREMRLEFLLKLWFARDDPERATTLVRAQTQVIDRHVASLDEQIAALAPDDDFGRTVLRLRSGQNHAIRDWLDSLHDLLEHPT